MLICYFKISFVMCWLYRKRLSTMHFEWLGFSTKYIQHRLNILCVAIKGLYTSKNLELLSWSVAVRKEQNLRVRIEMVMVRSQHDPCPTIQSFFNLYLHHLLCIRANLPFYATQFFQFLPGLLAFLLLFLDITTLIPRIRWSNLNLMASTRLKALLQSLDGFIWSVFRFDLDQPLFHHACQ